MARPGKPKEACTDTGSHRHHLRFTSLFFGHFVQYFDIQTRFEEIDRFTHAQLIIRQRVDPIDDLGGVGLEPGNMPVPLTMSVSRISAILPEIFSRGSFMVLLSPSAEVPACWPEVVR